MAAALAETEIPRITLISETDDYSNPWKPPTVRFELPEDWQGNTEFTEGGPVGDRFYRLWAAEGAHDMGRFVVVGAGPVAPPAASESIQAQDGTTWELSAWRDGLRMDATVTIAGDGESVTARQVQDSFDLLGASIVAARIPVP